MTPNDADRSGFSRQRLTRAAAASFALHMLLFGGLTVSKLDLAIRPSDSPAAREPKRPTRPAADFRLQVSRSASAKQPAHERPLEVPVKPAAVKPVDRREQPTERMIAAESPQLEEPPTEVTVSQPQFEPVRPRDTAAPPLQIDSPQRLSEAAPAETAATAALAPAAATVETAAAASPSPAATIPRESRSTGPVAARWRPREAALLERLTARVPDASALSARPTPTAAVPSSSAGSLRRQSPAAAAAGTTRAEAIAPPAAAEMPAVAALTPSAREPARRSSLRGAATRPAAAVNLAAAASDVPPLPATSLAATRVVSRSAASRAVLVPESPAGLAGSRSPLARRSAATATTAAAGGSAPGIEMPAIAAVSGQPASGGDSGRAASGGSETGRGDRLGPALLERGRRGATGRSALTAARGLTGAGVGRESAVAAEEGLSISPADLAALGSAGRRRTGLPERAAGPRSPKRIAVATLLADGRVRDVAEAFAGRRPAVGQPAGGIDDAADLDRARRMVEAGLAFLARSQQPDGRWRLTEFAGVTDADVPKLDSDTAATGLALLCFFGAGHDHFDGPHRDTVRRGLEFLISVQKPDGDLFLPADDLSNSCGWLYSHGIAAIAVCEAVGMTGDPLVRPAAVKACRFIADSRHPTLGGWRYTPRTDADLSVSGWMLVALRAGDLAGVPTDPAALDGVRTLLAASSTAGGPTRFAYNARKADQRRTDLSVACMTAVGTLMRLHTGAAADDPGVAASADALAALTPSYGTATRKVRDAYLWYYASQVLVHTGGEPWERWYGSLVDTLEPEQRQQGERAGSWDALGATPDRWGLYGGRVYVTALHLLALEVPWRHLPTYATAPAW